jgi:hypothetical protein
VCIEYQIHSFQEQVKSNFLGQNKNNKNKNFLKTISCVDMFKLTELLKKLNYNLYHNILLNFKNAHFHISPKYVTKTMSSSLYCCTQTSYLQPLYYFPQAF